MRSNYAIEFFHFFLVRLLLLLYIISGSSAVIYIVNVCGLILALVCMDVRVCKCVLVPFFVFTQGVLHHTKEKFKCTKTMRTNDEAEEAEENQTTGVMQMVFFPDFLFTNTYTRMHTQLGPGFISIITIFRLFSLCLSRSLGTKQLQIGSLLRPNSLTLSTRKCIAIELIRREKPKKAQIHHLA